MIVELQSISIEQDKFYLQDLSLNVGYGEHVILTGASGSGKTTLLEVIAGLRAPRSGRVFLYQKEATFFRASERRVAYVPQDAALFSFLNVADNLSFPLRVRKNKSLDTKKQVESMARALGIDHLLTSPVHHLSGGEAKRVALGRALLTGFELLLLDETLAGLDGESARCVLDVLSNVAKKRPLSILQVTHHPNRDWQKPPRVLSMSSLASSHKMLSES